MDRRQFFSLVPAAAAVLVLPEAPVKRLTSYMHATIATGMSASHVPWTMYGWVKRPDRALSALDFLERESQLRSVERTVYEAIKDAPEIDDFFGAPDEPGYTGWTFYEVVHRDGEVHVTLSKPEDDDWVG